jgi:hypothetical protein
MAETSSAQRTVSAGSHYFTNTSAGLYTKSINEYTWCYENSVAMLANSGTGFDECLPRLEIDDKPLIYRQQFEPTVKKNKRKFSLSFCFVC